MGSHEFMLSYALTRGVLYTPGRRHFHPTEVISAKISAILQLLPTESFFCTCPAVSAGTATT